MIRNSKIKYFCDDVITFVKHDPKKGLVFRAPSNLTKHEIRNYFKNIYNINVVNFQTINQFGKRKRIGKHIFRTSSYKKVIISKSYTL